MTKIHTSAVVIIPPKENWEQIQEIRRQYDHQIKRWMPHITLIYPFRPESEFDILEQKFSTICKNIKPFKITLKSFKYFSYVNSNFTIWLNPEPKDLLINLQKKIRMIVPNCNDVNLYERGFIPHLSVGQIKGKNQLITILKRLEHEWEKIIFPVNEIYFIARENNRASQFLVKKIISL